MAAVAVGVGVGVTVAELVAVPTGIFSFCPAVMFVVVNELAAWIAFTVTPYLEAILKRVSPETTV